MESTGKYEVLNQIETPIYVLNGADLIFQNSWSNKFAFNLNDLLNHTELNENDQYFSVSKNIKDKITVIQLIDITETVKVNQSFDDFVYIASHDLKEPVRKVSTFGNRLSNHAEVALDEKAKLFLSRMINASDRMQKMLDELLVYSRLKRDQSRDSVEIIGLVKRKAKENGVVLDISGESEVNLMANPVQIDQFFTEIFKNTAKFSEKEVAKATLTSRVNEGQVLLTLTDEGIGIDENDLESVKKPFTRLHGRSSYKGSGMGLAIASRIIELHGGSLTFKSQKVGVRIEIGIPL